MSFTGRIISKLERVATEQLAQSFLSGLVARKIKGNYILMYHGVTPDGNTRFNKRHVSCKCLQKQLQFIKKHFAVITLDDFFAGKFIGGKTNIALTFDDGYLNNYTYAKPLLEKYQCPATFFITGLNEIGDNILWADFVNIASTFTAADITIEGEKFIRKNGTYYSAPSGKSIYQVIKHERADYSYKLKVKEAFSKVVNFQSDSSIAEYWQLMSDEQIRETAQSKYIKIGCHGYYHNNLGTLPHQQSVDELVKAKEYLERITQQKIEQLAYPDGSYTPELVKSANQLGFKIELAVDDFLFNENDQNPYIKRRNGIYTVDSCLNQLFTALKKQS